MSTLLMNPIIRFGLLLLALGAVGFSFDPLLLLLDAVSIQSVGILLAIAAGFCGYKFLAFGADDVVTESTRIVTDNQWSPALIPGIIAFGTSLSELGFVIVSTVNNENEILVHSIIGSDGFQLGGIFFVCVAVAKISHWDAKLLRADMWLLSLMTFFVLSAVRVGFTRQMGALIAATALLSAWQFLKDAPEGVFEADEPDPDKLEATLQGKVSGSPFNLITGFGLLLLGTVWFFDAIIYSGGVFGIPAFVLGLVGAVITSSGEVFTTFPLVKSGEKGLFFAAIALAGSNAFDTSFLGLSALFRPFSLAPAAHNALPALVTMGLTLLLLGFTYRSSIPRWVGLTVVPVYIISFVALALV
ncbi:MAG: hypothetical protein AAGC93_24065 [Cyanobacteria bacterium P01_F01_bin.53]